MKNLMRSSTTSSDLERSPNPLMHCREYDPRQMHDHQHGGQSFCFAGKSEHPTPMDHQHRLFPCGNGPHMHPMVARSLSCSQLSGLVDYPSDAMKQQQHCKSEKQDEDGPHLSAKCQMHSGNSPDATAAGILVKTEFTEMQSSKSSPVHEVFEMTSRAFASPVTASGSSQFQQDTGSPPLSLAEATNSSAASGHHLHHHHQQQLHQMASAYESYVYASGSRVGMSSRQTPGALNATTASGSEISAGLYHCKSFFSDSPGGSGSGIAAFYPSSQPPNGESCRDDSTGFSGSADDKVAISIKSRKISD